MEEQLNELKELMKDENTSTSSNSKNEHKTRIMSSKRFIIRFESSMLM